MDLFISAGSDRYWNEMNKEDGCGCKLKQVRVKDTWINIYRPRWVLRDDAVGFEILDDRIHVELDDGTVQISLNKNEADLLITALTQARDAKTDHENKKGYKATINLPEKYRYMEKENIMVSNYPRDKFEN